jgi:hypothetical protein
MHRLQDDARIERLSGPQRALGRIQSARPLSPGIRIRSC